MLGGKITLVLGVALLIVSGMFYGYFKITQAEIATLQKNAVKLEAAVESQKETLRKQQEDYERVSEQKEIVDQAFDATRQDVVDLQSKLNKVSKLLGARDIGKLAAAKPDSIERVVNKGSRDLLRCFEIASGAELTEEEKNAFKPSQINRSCPGIANPAYLAE